MHAKQFSSVKRWIATSILSLLTIAFVWQGMFIANDTAMADSVMLADLGDRVENKADRDLDRSKGFIENTKEKVKETANKNASKVDRATDNDSLLENKAKKDANRIENKADKDAARTKKAVDKTQNIIESTVDNIKDVFSN
ncbi:hypothetical protein C7B62_00560 [Pleurocapsa sp. CCALA 161]|uniref:hypothetical protein n=1 Tax=Pleurocapsa sp. CCALA 161 TaxID=2107688 RepID=UPI000D07E1EB|nr:hypothetical protein [Pleurocapsa sp. CCALA 161]PSB12884.1 hypothetical protein C7B62_00560 [Pleurocapsa sp. CCALA 161]